jgi:acyl-CoA thioester hydrolase
MAVDEPFIITSQLLAYDAKRIHQFMRMYHANDHYLVATAEWLNLHIDLTTRRVAPWPDEIRASIAAFAERQHHVDWPDEAGKIMHVPNPDYSIRPG